MFAHVLRDETGLAARVFLDERGDLPLSCSRAEQLARHLEQWRARHGEERTLPPADFVQQRWHEVEGGDYRNYVSDLLLKEEVPHRTDFAKAIRESLQRLRQGQPRPTR
jgi:hypothetical protein